IRAAPNSSSAAARPSPACPTAPIIRGSPISRPTCAATGVRFAAERQRGRRLRGLAEAIVERVASTADGADRVGLVAAIERLAQPPDMDVDGAFVDVDLAAPDAIEQLLAGEHTPGTFHQELEQAVFGRSEVDRAAAARDPFLLAVDLEVAE